MSVLDGLWFLSLITSDVRYYDDNRVVALHTTRLMYSVLLAKCFLLLNLSTPIYL